MTRRGEAGVAKAAIAFEADAKAGWAARALSAAEVAEGLGLSELRGRRWHCQSTVATQGLGLYEGLDWLSGTLKSMQSRGLRTSVGTSGAKGTNFSAAGVKKSVMSFF